MRMVGGKTSDGIEVSHILKLGSMFSVVFSRILSRSGMNDGAR